MLLLLFLALTLERFLRKLIFIVFLLDSVEKENRNIYIVREMKNYNSKSKQYYRIDRKGTRKVYDVLRVFPQRKTVTFYNNCRDEENLVLKARHLSYAGFNKKIEKLSKSGYEIEIIDGVSSRVCPDSIRKGLNCEIPLEAIESRLRFRRTPDFYFDRCYIEKAKDAYRKGRRNNSYLDAWVMLFNQALQESIRHGDKKTTKIVLAICSCLSELSVILKESESGKEKNKTVENVRKALAKLDANWKKDRTNKKNALTESLK